MHYFGYISEDRVSQIWQESPKHEKNLKSTTFDGEHQSNHISCPAVRSVRHAIGREMVWLHINDIIMNAEVNIVAGSITTYWGKLYKPSARGDTCRVDA